MKSFEVQLTLRRRAGRLGAIAALGALLLAGSASASQVLVNGDLEQPGGVGVRTPLTAAYLPGWTYSGIAGDDYYEASGMDGVLTADGGHYVSLGHNGGVGGSISQTFATVLGGAYNLSYLFGEQQGADAGQVLRATITQGLNTWTVDNSPAAVGFTAGAGLSFIGDGTLATLTFFDATPIGGGGGSNLALDNILLDGPAARPGGGAGGVPEPATWAMMILGFGMAGVMARRARTLAA